MPFAYACPLPGQWWDLFFFKNRKLLTLLLMMCRCVVQPEARKPIFWLHDIHAWSVCIAVFDPVSDCEHRAFINHHTRVPLSRKWSFIASVVISSSQMIKRGVRISFEHSGATQYTSIIIIISSIHLFQIEFQSFPKLEIAFANSSTIVVSWIKHFLKVTLRS